MMLSIGIWFLAAAFGAISWGFAPGSEAGLAGTLALAPLIAAGFAEIERWARRRGGAATPDGVVTAELVALGALLLVAGGAPALGLRWASGALPPLLVAGLVLLVFHRAGRAISSLAPTLGDRLPARPAAAFFFVPLLVYLAPLPWLTSERPPDGDEPYYLLITHSLLHEGDTDLDDNYERGDSLRFMERRLEPQFGDPVGPDGERYSRHAPLLPLFLLPLYALAGGLGACVTMAILAAALAWATLRLARHYVPQRPRAALAAYAVLALTPPLLLYSYQVWVEAPAALVVVLALDLLLEMRSRGAAAPIEGTRTAVPGRQLEVDPSGKPWPASLLARVRSGWRWLAFFALLALLVLLKIRFLGLAGPLVVLGFLLVPRARRAFALAGGLFALVAVSGLAYNAVVYGRAFRSQSLEILKLNRVEPLHFVASGTGLLFDVAYGLVAFAPLWLLLLPALPIAVRRLRPELLHFGVLFGPYLLFVMASRFWFGAWSPPFRYALVTLPLLAIFLTSLEGWRERPGRRALVVALAALTLLLALVWTAAPGWTYNLAHGRSYLLDRLSTSLGSDVARLFPSSVRPRLATWVWPPLALGLAMALWWLPGRRRGHAAGAGVTLLLLAAAAGVVAAERLPSRTVELEDPMVVRRNTREFPEPWERQRAVLRGGLLLSDGGQATAPVVAGGSRLTAAVDLRLERQGELELELWQGERLLGRRPLAPGDDWQTLRFDDLEWERGGGPLTFVVVAPPTSAGEALLDRVRLEWE